MSFFILQDENGNVCAIDSVTGALLTVGAANAGVVIGGVQLVDENGTAYGVKQVDNKPRTSAMPYSWDIAEGNVADHDALRKFGHNSDIPATPEDVWDGSAVYVYLTSAEQLQVASADIDDQGNVVSSGTATGGSTTTLVDSGADFVGDGVAAGDIVLNDTNAQYGIVKTVDSGIQLTMELAMRGSSTVAASVANASGDTYRVVNANDSGAAVVELQGLDGSYNLLFEYIVLNGQANVTTIASFLRVFRMRVLLAGASGWNEGAVTGSNNADTNVLAQITAQRNQTLMALWTVPAGKTAFLTHFYAYTSSSKATEVILCVRELGGTFQVKKLITIFEGGQTIPYDFPRPIAQKSDICILASAGGGGGEVSAGFDLWYESS